MNCKTARKLISAYIDGELGSKEKRELELHLSTCIYCRKELESTKKLIKVLHSIPKIEPSSNFSDKVWYKLQQEDLNGRNNFKRLLVLVGLSIAIVIMFLLGQIPFMREENNYTYDIQTFYELHGKFGRTSTFEENVVDYVLYQK
ncbi:MAG: anti-sigma factor [Dictyoglomus sp. NZ13-RE01]|nr:MAG: anti-sigma factor [Dictyoglomus sp. NZ13-RE01]